MSFVSFLYNKTFSGLESMRWVTRQVSYMKYELCTLSEYLGHTRILVRFCFGHLFSFLSPHLTYPLHARWRIRPWCTTSIGLCLRLLSLSLPIFSSLVCLFPSLPPFSKLHRIVQLDVFTQRSSVSTSMMLHKSCYCPHMTYSSPSFCIIISLAISI